MILRHGHTCGYRLTPEYMVWQNMLQRCQNPKKEYYRRYGGRGIRVCDRWSRFENFLADVGPRPSPSHSIDRIDNDGHYEPGNVRWATKAEQTRNTSRARLLTVGDITMCLTDWCRLRGIKVPTAWQRLKQGVDPAVVFKTSARAR